jgi:hypothetical protein
VPDEGQPGDPQVCIQDLQGCLAAGYVTGKEQAAEHSFTKVKAYFRSKPSGGTVSVGAHWR